MSELFVCMLACSLIIASFVHVKIAHRLDYTRAALDYETVK